MRLSLALLALLIGVAPAVAQRRGVGVIGGTSNFASRSISARAGFGNILFPGTGGPPPVSFGQRLSGTITGNYGSLPGWGAGGRHHRPPVVYPVPVYYGGWYGGYGGYQEQPPVQVTVQQAPVQQPPVIINQYYNMPEAKPVVRDYTNQDLPEPAGGMRSYHAPVPSHPEPKAVIQNAEVVEQEATIYLIAFKDQTIYPAIGYWLEGDTLHYTTLQGSHNQASIALIDRELTQRLNSERGVEFELAP